ncbi:MAG: circularly permuted type 2 ATP-grasp protein, partial [Gammaproteobacteria bacterium]
MDALTPEAMRELLTAYHTPEGVLDEAVASDGSIKPAWQPVFDRFARMSDSERNLLQETAQRLLGENGVTFVAQDDADSRSRPWNLDLFPLQISADDWRTLEAGLIQRARVLNDTLADLYGPQRLLKAGILPPSVVFGNPQFLPPCAGVSV